MENNLKKIVTNKGIKHRFLADSVGVSVTAFSYWINNHRQPSGIFLAKLCKELGCTAEEIYGI
jgi:DNA-binding Xre family transcriptional regulator|tara:strand:- start:257 stop:445 length:189 start_codon:yes stop_codon:yes gene_type:complete